MKPLPDSLCGSHGALAGVMGDPEERDKICVNDEGSAGEADCCDAPDCVPNICVSEGCGEFRSGAGVLESPRSRSSAGSLVNSSVNPPLEAGDGAEEATGNAVGDGAGAGAGVGNTGADVAAAPPKLLKEAVAERLNVPVPLSGPNEIAGSFSFTGSVAAAVLKSDVNPPEGGADGGTDTGAAGNVAAEVVGGTGAGVAQAQTNQPARCRRS